MNYSAGVSNIKITSEKDVTIDQIVAEADIMWKWVKKNRGAGGDLTHSETLMRHTREQHPEFCKSYPIVQRYMCQMYQYRKKAFKRWLRKINIKPWKSEEEYLDSQTDYVAILFKVLNPNATATNVSHVRGNIRNMLQNEHDTFKKYAHRFSEEVTNEEKELHELNTKQLREFMTLVGVDGLQFAEKIRVESDVQPIITDDIGTHHKVYAETPENISLTITSSDLLD